MDISAIVLKKLDGYGYKNGLDQTVKVLLKLASINHIPVKEHEERVDLLSEETAIRSGKQSKAAFIGGLTHDTAKLVLPYYLFEDKDISNEEYEQIKKHALMGFEIFKDMHEFTALCAGLHHALYKSGYGLKLDDFPSDWSLEQVRKVFDISVIISIADFIDAYTHRHTSMKNGSGENTLSLEEMLKKKYPDDHRTIEIALQVQKELNL